MYEDNNVTGLFLVCGTSLCFAARHPLTDRLPPLTQHACFGCNGQQRCSLKTVLMIPCAQSRLSCPKPLKKGADIHPLAILRSIAPKARRTSLRPSGMYVASCSLLSIALPSLLDSQIYSLPSRKGTDRRREPEDLLDTVFSPSSKLRISTIIIIINHAHQ